MSTIRELVNGAEEDYKCYEQLRSRLQLAYRELEFKELFHKEMVKHKLRTYGNEVMCHGEDPGHESLRQWVRSGDETLQKMFTAEERKAFDEYYALETKYIELWSLHRLWNRATPTEVQEAYEQLVAHVKSMLGYDKPQESENMIRFPRSSARCVEYLQIKLRRPGHRYKEDAYKCSLLGTIAKELMKEWEEKYLKKEDGQKKKEDD